MRGKFRTLLATLLLVAGAAVQEANAFCVYNATESRLMVNQLYRTKGMRKDMSGMQKPGHLAQQWNKNIPVDPNAKAEPTKACCNVTNTDCSGGSKSSAVSLMLRVQVKQGTNIGLGTTGGEGYTCGQLDDRENMAVKFTAGGWVVAEPNPKFNSSKEPASNNPKFLIKVFNGEGGHMKTFPCPGAPRNATWGDLIPDWSDVIAG